MKRFLSTLCLTALLCAGGGCQTPSILPSSAPYGAAASPASPASSVASDWADVPVGALEDTQLLALINGDHPIPDGGVPYPTVSAYQTVPLAAADILMHPRALEAADALFTQAETEGFDGFFITSGYRTSERQKQLYKKANDKSYVQKPGHSEHQTGLAADIAYTDIGQAQFGDSAEGRWLAQNAWKYGFILRYPEDKRDVTGIAFEPWHFRYVGQPHAAYCHDNGLCLEEYLQLLADSDGFDITLEHQTYSVFYARPRDDIIRVPREKSCEISSDNTGGYIITVWED